MKSNEERRKDGRDQEKSVKVTWGEDHVSCLVIQGDMGPSRLIEIMRKISEGREDWCTEHGRMAPPGRQGDVPGVQGGCKERRGEAPRTKQELDHEEGWETGGARSTERTSD